MRDESFSPRRAETPDDICLVLHLITLSNISPMQYGRETNKAIVQWYNETNNTKINARKKLGKTFRLGVINIASTKNNPSFFGLLFTVIARSR